MSEKKKNNPGFVTRAEFEQAIGTFKDELKVVKKALVGDDLRHGLVKDVADIKSNLRAWAIVKNILVSIAIAVSSALITAYVLGQILHP